jgi:hypothetical protein
MVTAKSNKTKNKSKPSASSSSSEKKSGKNHDGMDDWIASLAKQVTKGDTAQGQPPTTTKEERIQKRSAKKAQKQQQQQQERQQHQQERQQHHHDGQRRQQSVNPKTLPHKKTKTTDTESVQRRLKRIAQWMVTLQSEHDVTKGIYTTPTDPDRVRRTRALNEINIQPRTCDYSGIGLARKSLFIPLQDPSHIPKLTQEFKEHIPGFFGRQRTKAMKRQLDGNMLWRQLANQKRQQVDGSGGGGGGGGMLSKKFANLSPDERVQAMIDAGMI